MNPRGHFERKSETNTAIDKGELAERIYRPVADSWLQKRLVQVRKEFRKEMQTKITRLTKDQ